MQVMKFMEWKENLFPRGIRCKSKSFAGAWSPSCFTCGFGCLCSRLVLKRCGCVTWDEAVAESAVKEWQEATLGLPALLESCRKDRAVGHCSCTSAWPCPSAVQIDKTWLHGLTSDLPHYGELAWGSSHSWLTGSPALDLLCSSCLYSHHPTCSAVALSSGFTFPYGAAHVFDKLFALVRHGGWVCFSWVCFAKVMKGRR